MNKMIILLMSILTTISACDKNEAPPATAEILYTMPEESEPHEGTWLNGLTIINMVLRIEIVRLHLGSITKAW